MSNVDNLKKVLKTEYGIDGEDELNLALTEFKGINLGIFITPLFEVKNGYKE
jgi:hypothetical protein